MQQPYNTPQPTPPGQLPTQQQNGFQQDAQAITAYQPHSIGDIRTLALASWGDIKTCKTTFGWSMPKPLIHFDFDQGFERAASRIPPGTKVLKLRPGERLTEHHLQYGYDVISIEYQVPVQFPGIRNNHTLQLFERYITPDIMLAINCPWIASIFYDTGTVMWRIATQAELEEKRQGNNPNRQRLIQVEYATPNQNMRFFLGAPKGLGKQMYIAHHQRRVYEDVFSGNQPEPVGQKYIQTTWDGWSQLGRIIDVVGVTGVKKHVEQLPPIIGQPPQSRTTITPCMMLQTCGYTLAAEGQELENPTWDSLLQLINNLRQQEQSQL